MDSICRSASQAGLDTEDILKYEFASAPTKARTLGQIQGNVESRSRLLLSKSRFLHCMCCRYLDSYSGILQLERDPGTVSSLTLGFTPSQVAHSTVVPAIHRAVQEGGKVRRRKGKEGREEAERKKPPPKSQSSVLNISVVILSFDLTVVR